MIMGLKRGIELLEEVEAYNYEEELLIEDLIEKFKKEIEQIKQ